MSEEHIDLPYVKDQGSSTLQLTGTTTLSREPWKAQDSSERSKPAPPSVWTLFISMVAVIMCPLLGCMAFIFAVQGKQKYNHGEYFESEALCSRARGTAYYAIAVGIGIALFLALVLGLGPMFNWY